MSANVDTDEIQKFAKLAARWWDPSGEMAPLHVINPVRLRYVDQAAGGLAGKSVLDVGCGGGILTEALARAGARALGIDMAEASIDVAREHAQEHHVSADYRLVAAETLAAERPASFDIVCCLEMLEHVPDPAQTVDACARLVRPEGTVVFSTINRNAKSYALMIVAAEYVLRLLPRGTHDYGKFIRPSELDRWARAAGLETVEVSGLQYDPLLKTARLSSRDLDINYLMTCRKPA
jgi:2-polyprenyl-6-hydroxyphenyl methylase/3-demethylubiquinone-9 3-methyltransferase